MRAARFISRFNLTLDKGIKESVNELKERLRIVSEERIRDELNKLLTTSDPNPGFKFLLKTNLYETFLPELKVAKATSNSLSQTRSLHTPCSVVNQYCFRFNKGQIERSEIFKSGD
ncbi:MAG: hypothetical protein CM15mP49_23970 [Actinomycetota bacterium]|nr:MAG: hypothetical protein CM15mP49_23970 [Actinomycetota bacterium]